MQAHGGLPAVSRELLCAYRQLVENDVAADIARQLVECLQQVNLNPDTARKITTQ